jgi:hypothetical protein
MNKIILLGTTSIKVDPHSNASMRMVEIARR